MENQLDLVSDETRSEGAVAPVPAQTADELLLDIYSRTVANVVRQVKPGRRQYEVSKKVQTAAGRRTTRRRLGFFFTPDGFASPTATSCMMRRH